MSQKTAIFEVIDGKITSVEVDGKPIPPVKLRLLQQVKDKCPYFKIAREAGFGTNPFSGVTVELNTLELSIYKFCTNWIRFYEAGMTKSACVPVSVFDRMKYFLLDLDPDAYMDLLD
jgi:hypothetical protein